MELGSNRYGDVSNLITPWKINMEHNILRFQPLVFRDVDVSNLTRGIASRTYYLP